MIFNIVHMFVLNSYLNSITKGESDVTSWSIYQEGSLDTHTDFDARIKLNLRFHGDNDEDVPFEFIEWISPAECEISSTKNKDASVVCPEGNYYLTVKMKHKDSNETVTDSKYARFLNHAFCYKWYAFADVREWTENGEVDLRLWVTDPLYQNNAESTRLAENPSKLSKTLTSLFQARGQQPILSELFAETREELQWNNISYNSGGYWIASIKTGKRLQYVVRIDAKIGLTLNACLIRATEVCISIPKFTTNERGESDLKLKGLPTLKRCVKDPCAMHVAIAIRSNEVLFTQNGFISVSEVYVPITQTWENDVLVDAAFTSDKLYLLMASGQLIYMTTNATFHSVEESQHRGLTSIRGTETCVNSNHLHHKEKDMILTWNETKLYLTEDGPMFYQLEIPQDLIQIFTGGGDLQVAIMESGFSANVDAINVILRIENHIFNLAVVILRYELKTEQWTRSAFWIESLSVHGCRLMNCHKNIDNVVIWNKKMLFSSKLEGTESGIFVFNERVHANRSNAYSHDIENVEVCTDNVFVQLSTGRLYSGRMPENILFEVSPLPPDSFLYCDFLGSVFSVSVQSSNYTSKELIIRNTELDSAFQFDHGNSSCQFVNFETMTKLKALYYLDRNEKLFLWSRLTFKSKVFNTIVVTHSKMNTVSVKESMKVDNSNGRKAVNKSIIIQSAVDFYQSVNYNISLRDATGLFTIKMEPEKTGLGCIGERTMTTRIMFGCPPGRHVRVQKPAECSSYENFILPSGAHAGDDDKTSLEERIVNLDKNEYGCPLIGSHKTSLKPKVHLYDGEETIEVVSTDYVLYELQRRTDFTYNATQSMVNCRRASQSWNVMKDATSEDSPLIWAANNYRKCFVSDGTPMTSSDLPYEILNQTGLSALQWEKNELDQLYLFQLTVVDPNYSFCSLHTKFAVVVKGSLVGTKTTNRLTLFMLISFAVVTLSLGIASYAFFRKEHMEEWKRNQAFVQEDMGRYEEDEEEMSLSEEAHMAARKQHRRQTVLER